MGKREARIGNRKQEMGNREWEMGNRKPRNQEPIPISHGSTRRYTEKDLDSKLFITQ